MTEALQFNAIAKELNATTSDRATAVLGGALVEGLTLALLEHVLAPAKHVKEFLMRAEHADRLTIAFGIGLLPKDLYSDLKLISRIRNDFAHTIEMQSFDQEPIMGRVASLIAPARFGTISGEKFIDPTGGEAATLKDLPRRLQFVAAVAGSSVTLQHIHSEAEPFRASTRFYVNPNGGTQL